MFYLAGAAASSALDLISTLQQTLAKTSATPSGSTQSFDPAATAGATGPSSAGSGGTGAPLAPMTMDALLTVQTQGQTPLVNGDAFSAQLFSLLDANHDGAINKSEFEAAFGQNGNTTKADAIFAQLDANADGSVSPDELTSALGGNETRPAHHHHHHHHGDGGEVAALSGANASAGAGASGGPDQGKSPAGESQTETNPDGSTTTTISCADGSQVTMTVPAANGGGSATAAPTNNFIERMIERQAQMLAASAAGQTLAVSA
jgi:EF hand